MFLKSSLSSFCITCNLCVVWTPVPNRAPAALNTGLLWGQLNTWDTKEAASCTELTIGPRIARVGSFSLHSILFFIGTAPAGKSTWRAAGTVLAESTKLLFSCSQGQLSWSTSSTKSVFELGTPLLGCTRFSFLCTYLAHNVFMGWTINNCSYIWGTCWIFKGRLFIFKFAAIIET